MRLMVLMANTLVAFVKIAGAAIKVSTANGLLVSKWFSMISGSKKPPVNYAQTGITVNQSLGRRVPFLPVPNLNLKLNLPTQSARGRAHSAALALALAVFQLHHRWSKTKN
jgi:hypothetical protein